MNHEDILLTTLYVDKLAEKISDPEIKEMFINLVSDLRYLHELAVVWQNDHQTETFKKLPSDERMLALCQSDALDTTIQILHRRILAIHNNQKV